MVQQSKYYSKRRIFPEPQCLRNDGGIDTGMANDDVLITKSSRKQVLREISQGLVSSAGVIYQTTKQTKANHTLPSGFNSSHHPTKSQRENKSTSISTKAPLPLAKPG